MCGPGRPRRRMAVLDGPCIREVCVGVRVTLLPACLSHQQERVRCHCCWHRSCFFAINSTCMLAL